MLRNKLEKWRNLWQKMSDAVERNKSILKTTYFSNAASQNRRNNRKNASEPLMLNKKKIFPFLLLFLLPKKRNQDENFFNKHFSANLMNTFEWLSLFPVPFLLNWSDKGLIWEVFYLKELFLSDTSFGPAWVQDFPLLMQFTPSGPFLILVISKNVKIHLLLEVPFLWPPIWIGAYILTFPAEFMAVIVSVL